MSIIVPFSTESHPKFLSMNEGFVSLWGKDFNPHTLIQSSMLSQSDRNMLREFGPWVSMDMNSIARFQARTYKIVEFWDDEFEKADAKSKKA